MRVGLVWPASTPLIGATVRYERYVRGFRSLGHEAVTVCLPTAAEAYGEPTAIAPDEAALADADFYRPFQFDAAVVITWLALPHVVRALKAGCPWVVSVADSDGRISPRAHPRATLLQGVLQHRRWTVRARAAKFWAERYLNGTSAVDADVIRSASLADAIAINSRGARHNLATFFRLHRRPELADKVIVVPYPVDDDYLRGDVPIDRPRRVVAVGRWDDPQKDAPLLLATVARVAEADPTIGFDVTGPGGGAAFESVARQHPQVIYHGRSDRVPALLRGARVLLSTSRWESGPIVANEALSVGCTLVGPTQIPTIAQYCESSEYGRACVGRSASTFAAGILQEMRLWDEGRRDPAAIAAAWRPKFEPAEVCRQLLEGYRAQ